MTATASKSPINTKKVSGRRNVHYSSYDDLLADAETLSQQPVRTLGNWTYSQILKHLAQGINLATIGSPALGPWYIRLLAPLLKKRFLTRPMLSGFKFSDDFQSFFVGNPSQEVNDALADLNSAVERIRREGPSHLHPIFGAMTAKEWELLSLRHGELHMSFAQPA